MQHSGQDGGGLRTGEAAGLTIGEVAEALGVATHVLRHWEDEGLLRPARNGGGHRRYTTDDVIWARMIRRCQRAQMSLADIGRLAPGATGRREVVATHRARIARQQRELAAVEGFLAHVLACTHPIVEECPECRAFSEGPNTARSSRTETFQSN